MQRTTGRDTGVRKMAANVQGRLQYMISHNSRLGMIEQRVA
jgi:hypothetical protein